jgi:alpha-tubulin suppressor-like RCC1 family protein
MCASGLVLASSGPAGILASGYIHACALNGSGGVECWGDNEYGELGNGLTTPSSTPVAVTGLASGAAAVATGEDSSCALTTAGAVVCWGENNDGQLGNGTTTNSSTPEAVTGLSSGVAALASSAYHICALTSAGAVECWGSDTYGELGNNSTSNSSVPVAVSGLSSGVVAVVAGANHSCALTTAGAVQCWGSNQYGQLGNGTANSSLTPVTVTGLSSAAVAIAAGYFHTCALLNNGYVYCWGDNLQGQIGSGASGSSLTPVVVNGFNLGVAIAAGGLHTCALKESGSVYCFGNNTQGELGNGSTTSSSTPVAASLASTATAITAGDYQTCALTAGRSLACWGNNARGQLGNGTTTNESTPVTVSGLTSGITVLGTTPTIASGQFHVCAQTSTAGAECWGYNEFGQLGNGTTTSSSTPVGVIGLSSGVAAVGAGGSISCALTTAGGAQCWGYNFAGDLGNNSQTNSNVPVQVSGLSSGVAAIAVGDDHVCALLASGGVMCWGNGVYGELGNNQGEDDAYTPVAVSGLSSGIAQISGLGYHECALTVAGGVECWGNNGNGQIGNGSTASDIVFPVAVAGLAGGIVQIAAGYAHTCALTGTGVVECWGDNTYGELGNGTTTGSSIPVAVTGLPGPAMAVAAGDENTCALTRAGAVYCWGLNELGQLGNGTTANSSTPVPVTGLSSGVLAIAMGDYQAYAVTTGGAVEAWGDGGEGQLGNGSNPYDSSTPVVVSGLTVYAPGGSPTLANEPSTDGPLPLWAVGALGAGLLGLASRRRRKA